MAKRPSTRAAGAHRATIPPGFPPTAPSRWRAIRWVSCATSYSKAGRPARSSTVSAPLLRKGAKHDRRATAEGCDGPAPGLRGRLQRSRTAGDRARLRRRSGRRAVATEVQPGRRSGLDLPYGCRQPRRSRGHPGAAVRWSDGRHRRPGRPVGLEAARAPVVSIRELGTLGGAVSQAKAVNRRGQVVGTSRDGLGRTRAFLWQEDLAIVDLQPLTGVNTSANDINDNGEIVGGGDTGFGDFHAYFLSAGTSFDLGTLGGATSVAHDLNDRGEAVGLAETETGAPRAFVWTATDGMRDLGTLGAASMALGINDRTEVVGGSGHAFLWTARGSMVDLGTLGGRTSCANAINEAGCIVGASQTGETDTRGLPVTHAFLRTPQGGMLDLGTLGGAHSAAVALTDEEGGTLWITGHSHDASGRMRAVLWAVRLG